MTIISGTTEVYGIIGDPVRHSLSPAMHNRAFAALGLDKVYVALPAAEAGAAVAGIRALGIMGASVTIPHKQAVMAHLDQIDPLAARIGAVNTIVRHGQELHGFNTDWVGANRALADKMALAGKEIMLLGAGGSARAIGFGLQEAGARVILASRTPERGQELARQLGCSWLPLAEAAEHKADALVNATSVGMAPRAGEMPINAAAALANFPVVMDIVYTPLETALLAAARQTGCAVIDGLAMLLYQGAAQFELWTGQPAPLELMRETLLAALQNRT